VQSESLHESQEEGREESAEEVIDVVIGVVFVACVVIVAGSLFLFAVALALDSWYGDE
jgi:hypothetical protein